MGLPCVLIRLSGCNLSCSYCDTQYAESDYYFSTVREIKSTISHYYPKRILISGGEPLKQEQTPSFISALLKEDYQIVLETNGSLDVSMIEPEVIKIMDLKCPGSGECKSNLFKNLEYLTDNDEIKFVLSDETDFKWAVSIIKQYDLMERFEILFSPVANLLPPSTLSHWIQKEELDVRLQIQLHKNIWGDQRGV
ncbi:MAG: 7-carboxy-7-deazaguanine synthase QueE [bacterium]